MTTILYWRKRLFADGGWSVNLRFAPVLVLALLLPIILVQTKIALAQNMPGPLVSAEWVNSNLERENTVLLDIRSPRPNRDFYREGHVKGAVSAPYNEGWRKTIDGIIGMLPPKEEISDHIGGLGIDNNTLVVIIPFGNSSTDFAAATRIYWTFKVLGHDQVSILEGGYAAWLAKGYGLSDKPVTPEPKKFSASLRPELIASQVQVQQARASGDKSLVDARPTAQFNGKAKSPVVSKTGTIPGSRNLKQSSFYDPRQTAFADASEIIGFVQKQNLDGVAPVIAFCNTGHWATIAWFGLSEIMGKKNAAVYDGSMMEWALNNENPVE